MNKIWLLSVLKDKLKYNPNPIADILVVVAKTKEEAMEAALNYEWPEDIWLKNSKTRVRSVFALDAGEKAVQYRLTGAKSVLSVESELTRLASQVVSNAPQSNEMLLRDYSSSQNKTASLRKLCEGSEHSELVRKKRRVRFAPSDTPSDKHQNPSPSPRVRRKKK
jgi:hypothetical protein